VFEFPRFAAGDPRHAIELVRANPFAMVVSADGGAPVATHVPVIVDGSVEASFVGATLLGHMARVNPHWRAFEDSPEILVVFTGPHGYVSPTVYATDPAVPTWDYAAVHLTGRVELIDEPDGVLDVVERTVAALESMRSPQWRPSPKSRDRFVSLLSGVTAFRVHVTAERSLFKLSQDGDADRRGRVRDEFRNGPYQNAPLADLMDQVDPA
jgi:transcriptional regulator